MAAPRQDRRRGVASYTIRGTDTIVRAGDCVLMPRSGMKRPLSVALVQMIDEDDRGNANVHVRWFRRPEDSKRGKTPLHGERELILYDDYDVQSAHAIQKKCNVHRYDDYVKLDKDVAAEDYFCLDEYNAAQDEDIPY